MKDPVYAFFLTFSLVFGIALALAQPSFVVLYSLLLALSPFAARGLEYYRSIFREDIGLLESEGYDYRFALLGLLPLPLAVNFSWTDTIFGGMALIVIATAEETFRAGAVTLLKDRMNVDGWFAIVIANMAWIMYHFIQKPFTFGYFVFLLFGAMIFSLVLVMGGIGAAVLAHTLSNSLATWIALSVSGAKTVDITIGGILVLILFIVGVSGFARG